MMTDFNNHIAFQKPENYNILLKHPKISKKSPLFEKFNPTKALNNIKGDFQNLLSNNNVNQSFSHQHQVKNQDKKQIVGDNRGNNNIFAGGNNNVLNTQPTNNNALLSENRENRVNSDTGLPHIQYNKDKLTKQYVEQNYFSNPCSQQQYFQNNKYEQNNSQNTSFEKDKNINYNLIKLSDLNVNHYIGKQYHFRNNSLSSNRNYTNNTSNNQNTYQLTDINRTIQQHNNSIINKQIQLNRINSRRNSSHNKQSTGLVSTTQAVNDIIQNSQTEINKFILPNHNYQSRSESIKHENNNIFSKRQNSSSNQHINQQNKDDNILISQFNLEYNDENQINIKKQQNINSSCFDNQQIISNKDQKQNENQGKNPFKESQVLFIDSKRQNKNSNYLKNDKNQQNDDDILQNIDRFSQNNDKMSINNDKFSINNDRLSLNNDKFSINNDKMSINNDILSVGNDKFSQYETASQGNTIYLNNLNLLHQNDSNVYLSQSMCENTLPQTNFLSQISQENLDLYTIPSIVSNISFQQNNPYLQRKYNQKQKVNDLFDNVNLNNMARDEIKSQQVSSAFPSQRRNSLRRRNVYSVHQKHHNYNQTPSSFNQNSILSDRRHNITHLQQTAQFQGYKPEKIKDKQHMKLSEVVNRAGEVLNTKYLQKEASIELSDKNNQENDQNQLLDKNFSFFQEQQIQNKKNIYNKRIKDSNLNSQQIPQQSTAKQIDKVKSQQQTPQNHKDLNLQVFSSAVNSSLNSRRNISPPRVLPIVSMEKENEISFNKVENIDKQIKKIEQQEQKIKYNRRRLKSIDMVKPNINKE